MEGSAALAAMKAHVDRIRQVMNDINFELTKPTPNWKDLLGRYSVLSAQFHILLEEFNRKDSIMFPSLAIYPKKTIPENPNHIPLLLRSKTLPEIEEREKKLTQEFLATQEITTKTEDHKTELETRVESFNAMCDMLEDHFEQSRANYSFKKKREEIPLEDNSLHLNTIIEAIMTGKGITIRND
ncbi:uncharacterized protein ACA1_264750 [Acanthamoeba castellanii str. Neff]|uniref:Mediator of RNA polymerase II transcription subunit 8 n=1 Tax=Acanthamoeba castellanii (strain ATCC 30010 / Neff) TaxID=1257118 RepID=L8H4B1_ACACF|nr:uncharacterized protein ACA1_264750 [Acanthamoeba castellanii str. Neff]ELR19301.1 hypothetical protein ACA1_264750 [Acanthamoeba castellanii str. Neff]